MGDPKYPRKIWKKPKRPLNYNLKMEELKTLGTFGLKTKKELWKAHTELSRVRHQARSLLALGQEIRKEKEPVLLKSLSRIGLVDNQSTLDDVLSLQVTDLLARRLQTIVMKKFEFKTPYQARQAVVHGHVMIKDRIIDIPSYIVPLHEESDISLKHDSGIKAQLEKQQQQRPQNQSDEDRKEEINKNESQQKTASNNTTNNNGNHDNNNNNKTDSSADNNTPPSSSNESIKEKETPKED